MFPSAGEDHTEAAAGSHMQLESAACLDCELVDPVVLAAAVGVDAVPVEFRLPFSRGEEVKVNIDVPCGEVRYSSDSIWTFRVTLLSAGTAPMRQSQRITQRKVIASGAASRGFSWSSYSKSLTVYTRLMRPMLISLLSASV